MKKFTLMLIAAFMLAIPSQAKLWSWAETPEFVSTSGLLQSKRMATAKQLPGKSLMTPQAMNAKQAPEGLLRKMAAKQATRRAAQRATQAELAGTYLWEYATANEQAQDPTTVESTPGSQYVTISNGEEENTVVISGMFSNSLTGTLNSENGIIKVDGGQIAGSSQYGDYAAYGMFYYEGDEENEAGWYYDDIYIAINENGTLTVQDWIVRVLSGGQYDGYSLTPIWLPGSTLTASEGPQTVEAPADMVAEEYAMAFTDYDKNAGSASVNVGFYGNEVYVQGLCSYLPEAWVKGTLEGSTVTFAGGQYLGNYANYDFYFMDEDITFTYDTATNTLASDALLYTYYEQYYADYYQSPVLKKVVEVAAMPANPAITGLQNGKYGWYITFNVPNVDVDGNGLVSSKLSYILYTDVEKEISALTFTPQTHSRLTESLTEIPYGFTENYDFYSGQIYLNDLYSADWNKIGIQSIYTGGDQLNKTEIQWFDIKDYKAEAGTKTASWVAAEQGYENAQDITGFDIDDNISVTIAQNEGSNAAKYYTSGSALRLYDKNSITFTAGENVESIVKIVLNYTADNYSGLITATPEGYTVSASTGTWSGDATTVTFVNDKDLFGETSNKQARIKSIDVYYKTAAGEIGDLKDYAFDFEDGTLGVWTTIDADGDGYDWTVSAESIAGRDGSIAAFSQSYDNDAGALTPDNFLVSPKIMLDGSITFWACAQDASYPAEHFGVFISTKGNTSAADFVKMNEWDMTAVRADNTTDANARGQFRSARRDQGTWYQYTVNLSAYAGEEGYVAIRHFNCTDNFYLVVDDITLTTSKITLPDYKITPAEGEVKRLDAFQINFYNYTVEAADGAVASLLNTTTNNEQTADISVFDGNTLYVEFDETKEAGEYTLTIPAGALKNAETGEALEAMTFSYSIAAKPDVVVLPAEAQVETWYIVGNTANSKLKGEELGVAFVDNDIYIQGLCSYLPEAWVKGTITEGGKAVFASGQFYGTYEADDDFDLYFVGYDVTTQAICDVTFNFDAETGTLTTDNYILLNSNTTTMQMYDYYYNIQITRDMPELPTPLVAPEDLVTESYSFSGFDTYNEVTETGREVEVGFYGENEVWILGLSTYMPDAWVKGTIENNVITIPDTYLGVYQTIDWNTFSVVEYDVTFLETEFTYNAEAGTITAADGFSTVADEVYALDEYTDVVLTKIVEKEATPADPQVASFNLYYTPGEGDTELQIRTYPFVEFDIPTVSTEGEALVQGKLSYVVYIVDADGKQSELTLTPDLYPELTESMTEIPYKFTDNYDIYAGGNPLYLNQAPEEIASWQKIGVQSIYRGLDIEHRSNIGWFDIKAYIAEMSTAVGISNIAADNEGDARYFDIQGRAASASTKGLLIKQVRDAQGNVKTIKVVRK